MAHQIKPTAIEVIRIEGGTQLRNGIDDETVTAYAEAIKEGATFPPVTIFYDGFDYWLADGFHRFHAFKRAGKVSIPTEIHTGEQRDAWLFALGANATHGKTRTNADKRLQVTAAIQDAELSAWSDREIARKCGVGHPLVADIRKSLSGISSRCEPAPVVRKVERNGVVYEQKLKEQVQSSPVPISAARPEYTAEDRLHDELAGKQHAIEVMAEEIAALKDGILTEGDPDAKELIASLRAEIKLKDVELDAIKSQRDLLMSENHELKKQCGMYMKKLKLVA